MKKILFLLSVCFMFSCEDPSVAVTEVDKDVQVIDGRIAFSSEDAYFSQLELLAQGTEANLKNWEEKFKFNSLRKFLSSESEELNSLRQMPTSHQLILNSDAIVQVGSEVVWFNNEVKYYVSVEQFNSLRNIEDIAKLAQRKGIFKQTKIEADDASGRNFTTGDLGGGLGTGGDQHQFHPNSDPNDYRKYVTEFVSVYETGASSGNICLLYDTYVTLNCRIKMEWLSRKGWRPAGDPRNITWSFTPSNVVITFLNCQGANIAIPIATSLRSGLYNGFRSYYLDVPIASYRNLLIYAPSYGKWTGSVTGTVYQNMTNATPLHPHTINF